MQEACLLAERACRGQTESEVFAWLRTTAQRELWRIQKRARREPPVDIDAIPLHPDAWTVLGPEHELIENEDLLEVDEAAQAVLTRLSERQREIVALQSRGKTRPQIAAHLGMTQRTVKRQLERIMTTGRGELVRLAGHGCKDGETVVARMAFGLASQREIRDAQLHLALCRQCGSMFERLDLWRERVAAALPLPALEQTHPATLERAVHHLADGFASLRQWTSDGASGLRQQAGDSTGQLKQHASAVYYRVIDPTPLAGLRPGAAAAAIAGCLAIGGGTTYCVTQNVDPVRTCARTYRPSSSQTSAPRRTRHAMCTASRRRRRLLRQPRRPRRRPSQQRRRRPRSLGPPRRSRRRPPRPRRPRGPSRSTSRLAQRPAPRRPLHRHPASRHPRPPTARASSADHDRLRGGTRCRTRRPP